MLRLIDISKARPTRVASPCDIPTRLPGWDNRDTVRPTTFMMTTAMTGVMVALIEGKRFMLCGLDAEKRSGAPKMHPIEARQFLERYIARYQGQPSHIEVLLQTITAMQCYRTALSMCLERDMEFHSRLMRASGNLAFEIMFAPVMELLRDQRYKTVR